jgi:hypothetical protein
MKQLPERVSPPEPIQIGNGRSQPTPRSRPKWPLKWLLYLGLGVGAIGLSVLLLRPAPLRVDSVAAERFDSTSPGPIVGMEGATGGSGHSATEG